MRLMRHLVAVMVGVVVAGAATVGDTAAAPPTIRVGPDQYFAGLVNNNTGQYQPAVIRMACFGPIVPGEKGHPMAGQTLEVRYLGHSTTPSAADIGFTGPYGSEIGAFFGPPPPTPMAAAPSGPVIFRHYGVHQALPTSVLLPCFGSGVVPFIPIPVMGGSHEAVVPVRYVGQP